MCSVPPNCSVTPGNVNQSLGCPALIDTAPGWINNSPCGITLDREMVKADNLGTTFSQNAWAAAQEEGCLGCPNRYPSWPEPAVRPQSKHRSQHRSQHRLQPRYKSIISTMSRIDLFYSFSTLATPSGVLYTTLPTGTQNTPMSLQTFSHTSNGSSLATTDFTVYFICFQWQFY